MKESIAYICYKCISDKYLITFIRKSGKSNICYFCNKKRKSIEMNYLTEWIDEILHKYYISLPKLEVLRRFQKINKYNTLPSKDKGFIGYYKTKNNKNCSGLSVQTIIGDILLKCDNANISKFISNNLKEKCTFGRNDNSIDYNLTLEKKPNNIDKFPILWKDFCDNIFKSQRYFCLHGKEKLEKIFKLLFGSYYYRIIQ